MDLHAVLARCLGNTPGSTFLCCSISLQVYIRREAWETAEERQWRLQDGVSHLWLLKSGSGYCRTFLCSVTQAAKGSWREACRVDYMQDPSLQCQWTAEDLERHGRPCQHLLAGSSKSKWCVGVNHDWIPPCSRESHPRSAMPTFSSPPPPPPPPPPPCTNLTFTVPPVPAHLSDDQPCCSCFFSLPLYPPPPPPPPPVKVCAC